MLEKKIDTIWYKCFITQNHKYCLLDTERDIRATASNIQDISAAQKKYGWGNIHFMEYDGKTLKIGEEIK